MTSAKVPITRPALGEAEVEAASRVIRSGWITQGPEVAAFEAEMRKAKLDWQSVDFGGAVHSFTDPDAKSPGQAEYNPAVAKRAFKMMHDYFAEAFGT